MTEDVADMEFDLEAPAIPRYFDNLAQRAQALEYLAATTATLEDMVIKDACIRMMNALVASVSQHTDKPLRSVK